MALEFLGPIFGNFDPILIVYGAIFLIFFAMINFVLSKTFKDQYGNPSKVAPIISLCIAILILYYGGDFISNLFRNLSIDQNLLYWIAGAVIIIGLIILAKKISFCWTLRVIGTMLVIIGLTELVYQNGVVIGLGIFLIILCWIWKFLKWIFKRIFGRRDKNLDYQDKFYKDELKRRKKQDKENRNQSRRQEPVQVQQQIQEQEEKRVREQRHRSILDLKQKYTAYVQEKNRIQITFRGASGDQLEIARRQLKRIRQALETIIEMARRQGIDKRNFLSGRYGVSQRSPRDFNWDI